MAERTAYSNVIDSGMTFDEYVEFAGLEPGTDAYNELLSAYNSVGAESISVEIDYATIQEYLNNPKNAQAIENTLSNLNQKYSSTNLEVSIANWISDPDTIVLRDINGNIISIYITSYGVVPIGSPYPSGGLLEAGYSTALSGEVSNGRLTFTDKLRTASGAEASGFISSAASGFLAVACAAAFAKSIRHDFYKTAESFWGKEMYQFDPDWWDAQYAGRLTTGFRSFIAETFLAVNPDTEEVKLYVEDNFMAGVAAYLNSKGWFDGESNETYTSGDVSQISINYPVHAYKELNSLLSWTGYWDSLHQSVKITEANKMKVNNSGVLIVGRTKQDIGLPGLYGYPLYYVSKIDDGNGAVTLDGKQFADFSLAAVRNLHYPSQVTAWKYRLTINGKPVYISNALSNIQSNSRSVDGLNDWSAMWAARFDTSAEEERYLGNAAYIALYGDSSGIEEIDGVVNQDTDNKLETTSRKISPNEFKNILPVNFPELWADAIFRGVPQPNGSVITKRYVPVPIPNGTVMTNPTPSTGTTKQTEISTKLDTLPKGSQTTIIDTITTVDTPSTTPPKGDTGNTPLPLLPTGTASAMWAVYNPSQSEIDSFGAWMWSSDLFEQIKKIFNDPMQAIIGIHKIFGSPSIGGRRNIKVGYIDSRVSANYVSSQYTTVNCGSVNLYEYFGNVFDYSPFTSVKLYLPFVGVVPLDVADVMRSTISVEYGIDVYTGDCLAKVIVERDNSGGILYSYPGNCAVKYPYSSGSYLGIIGFGASIAATVATGVPMITSPKGALQTPHGGSFSGNSGATGPKTPYLIVSRPQSAVARNFNSFEGYPVNFTTQIGECRGFIRVKECHLSGINATDDELDMIDQILKDGIIVQS